MTYYQIYHQKIKNGEVLENTFDFDARWFWVAKIKFMIYFNRFCGPLDECQLLVGASFNHER